MRASRLRSDQLFQIVEESPVAMVPELVEYGLDVAVFYPLEQRLVTAYDVVGITVQSLPERQVVRHAELQLHAERLIGACQAGVRGQQDERVVEPSVRRQDRILI